MTDNDPDMDTSEDSSSAVLAAILAQGLSEQIILPMRPFQDSKSFSQGSPSVFLSDNQLQQGKPADAPPQIELPDKDQLKQHESEAKGVFQDFFKCSFYDKMERRIEQYDNQKICIYDGLNIWFPERHYYANMKSYLEKRIYDEPDTLHIWVVKPMNHMATTQKWIADMLECSCLRNVIVCVASVPDDMDLTDLSGVVPGKVRETTKSEKIREQDDHCYLLFGDILRRICECRQIGFEEWSFDQFRDSIDVEKNLPKYHVRLMIDGEFSHPYEIDPQVLNYHSKCRCVSLGNCSYEAADPNVPDTWPLIDPV